MWSQQHEIGYVYINVFVIMYIVMKQFCFFFDKKSNYNAESQLINKITQHKLSQGSFEQKKNKKYTQQIKSVKGVQSVKKNQYIYKQIKKEVSQLKSKQNRNIIMATSRITEQSTSQLATFYIEFINKLLELGNRKIVELGQLRNGVVLSDILCGIEDIELRGRYNEYPVGFVQILGNIKQLFKQVESYWKRVLGMELQEDVDLISVCKGGQQEELVKLIKLVIRTLLLSPEKERYIQHILQTSQQSQTYFMKLINSQSNCKVLTSIPNFTTHILYDRLQQVERQNQKLLKLIQQLQHEIKSSKQLCKQTDDKNRQQYRIISTLSQQLKLLKIHVYENQQQQQELGLLNNNQGKLQSKIEEKMIELCQQEQNMRKEINNLKSLVQTQVSELQQLSRRNSDLIEYKFLHCELITRNQLLQDKLQNLQSKFWQLQKQLQLSQSTNNKFEEQILILKKSLFDSENIVKQKNQVIEQLDNNIKYLLEESQLNASSGMESMSPLSSSPQLHSNHTPQSTALYNNHSITTTLKQQFQSVIISNRQHFILTKLTEQNILLNKQLKYTQEENYKLQSQIQQLTMTKQENHKLVQMITHMHNYRGEENQLLIKTIYRMRMKMLQQELIKNNHNNNNNQNHVLKDINRNH